MLKKYIKKIINHNFLIFAYPQTETVVDMLRSFKASIKYCFCSVDFFQMANYIAQMNMRVL